ncbi:hypothetical protein FACS1894169_01190 [Bacteroidia bacterium]|nr:hypothetical protein FACS1894169_01190 [Bacteroidia bacterium]
MAGQTRLELILDLNNRIGTGLAQARTQIRSEVGGMQARLGEFAANTKKNLASIGDGFTPIKSGLASIINPTTLVVAGIGLIGKGLMHATDRAAEFNHEFRDLANLNLDKSQAELNDLNKMVLNSAWRKGFNAEKTANAYNELQSTAGIYGAEARPIVEKQGEFAALMKTSMDDYVAGTAKAMANWRFGVDKLDEFNKSNYAAMQVGVVSFEELAKVQSTFAGSAASINQTFDTANKLFSLFTVKTKSVDEAATLTKSLFNDLTKATTVKAFKKIGIDIFDSNKQLKQADTIMLELNDKFNKMNNDKAIVNLKNQFKGSEGLIAMIQAATDKSGELRKMLDEFKDSKFNTDAAMQQEQNDIVARQERLANRIDYLVIRMGQIMLPVKEWVVGMGERAVGNISQLMKSHNENANDTYNSYTASVNDQFGHLKNVEGKTESEYKASLKFLQERSDYYYKDYEQKTQAYRNVGFWNTPFLSHFLDDKMNRLDDRAGYERQASLASSRAFKKLANDVQDAWDNKGKTTGATNPPPTGSGTGNGSGDLSGVSDSLNRVVGSASAPRNITINIDAFNKGGINTQNTSLQNMDAKQIEDWFTDMLMRVVNNAELSYNN